MKQNNTSYSHPEIFREIDGVVHFPGTTKEILNTYRNLKTKNSDVFIATWPKSGTTWTMEILWQMYNNARIDETRIDQKVPFLDTLCMTSSPTNQVTADDVINAFEGLPSPRLLKTHLKHEWVPLGESSNGEKPKIILVVRNPKDCAVSYFHHYKGLAILNCDCDWDEFFDLFMEGKLVCGSWFDFMNSWWSHRHDVNVLLVKYEDMKKDLLGVIKKIASFVGKDLDNATLQRMAEQTTFQTMQYRPAFDHKWFGVKPGQFRFMRKGQPGDWKNYFTDEQNRRFEERFEMEMKSSGLTLDYFRY